MTTTTQIICASSCLNQSWISSSNRLARWNFDNNLLDDTTNNSASSMYSPNYTTGYISQALEFPANVNQSLNTPTISLAGSSFTIDAWIYPTAFPNLQDHSIFGLCPLASNYECLYLTIRLTSGGYTLYFGLYGDDCPGNTLVSTNEWIHVAFVFDTNSYTQRIYINGKLDVIRAASGPFKASPGSGSIGNIPVIDSVSGPNYFEVS